MFAGAPEVPIVANAGHYPPLGLLYIAAYLEKHAPEHHLTVCDAPTDGLDVRAIIGQITALRPDVVGIYFATPFLYDALAAADAVKSRFPHVKIIAGGPHTALYSRETIGLPSVDCVIVGEAEKTFHAVISCLDSHDLDRIEYLPNVLTKQSPADKNVVRERISDLDDLPFPARHLLDHTKYTSIVARHNPITTIISSRGCPYQCRFCSNLESGQKNRVRSQANVVDELQEVQKDFGISDFLFFDELFSAYKSRVLAICDEIIRRGLKIRWHCRCRADQIDEEMLVRMKKAGCRLMQFGIETGTKRLQEYTNKKLDLDRTRFIIKAAARNRIYTYADFILGLPTESDEETEATIEFAKSLSLDYAHFHIYSPTPHSAFFEMGLKAGNFQDFWKEYVAHPDRPIAAYTWDANDREKYRMFYAQAFRSFYLRPAYMLRHSLRIDSWGQAQWQCRAAIKVLAGFFNRGSRPPQRTPAGAGSQ